MAQEEDRSVAEGNGNMTREILELLRESSRQIAETRAYVEKTLHVAASHFDTYGQRSGRPYYPLNDGWGLTFLNTGQPFFVNTEDRNLTPWIIMAGHWEPNVEASLLAYAAPGMTVLDIGAHIGYYTVKLATKVGSTGRLLAFEPNPHVNQMCLENIKINGLAATTTLHKLALGDQAGTARLTYSRSNMTSANLLGDQDPDVVVEVAVKKLDDVIEPGARVDLIKLDAEGYESHILKGAKEVLARSPECAVMIELGLDRWERSSTLDALIPLCGGNREAFAVCPDGRLRLTRISEMRQFLLTCLYHENYFLVAPPDVVRARLPHLLTE